MGGLLDSLSSYDTNIMLAAIIFLLLLILLLHVYARCFLSRFGRLMRAPPPPALTHLVMVGTLPYTTAPLTTTSSLSKGVEASAIASIPTFVYSSKQAHVRDEEECVICLSGFQEGEAGRRLAGCDHAFHVACIDTWLRSHTTCPVCRKEHDAVSVRVRAAEEEEDTNASSLPTSSTSIPSVPSISSSNINNNNNNSSNNCSSSSSSSTSTSNSSSSSSSSSLRSSLKRILSRNRSESSKVFPSNVNVNVNAADQLDV